MNYEYEINKIKAQLQNLQEIVLKMSRGNTEEVGKREQTTAQVDNLTPYTETEMAYIGDTQVVFVDAPEGNLNVYFSNYNGGYSTERMANGLIVFLDEPLEEVTEVTISIQ